MVCYFQDAIIIMILIIIVNIMIIFIIIIVIIMMMMMVIIILLCIHCLFSKYVSAIQLKVALFSDNFFFGLKNTGV